MILGNNAPSQTNTLMTPLHNDRPTVSNDAISQYLKTHQKLWQAQIPEHGTRLFYTEAQWAEIIATLNNNEGLRPKLRTVLFEVANHLKSLPTPEYMTPEQVSAENGKELFVTEQELWQRPVGDNIFLLCLAAKLSAHSTYTEQLRNTVVAGCRYPQWGRREVNMDLACGHMARAVALAWDWHRSVFDEDEQLLIRETMKARCNELLNGLKGGVFWARSYTENHNHVSAAALGFAGLAFYGDIPEAKEWLAAACVNFENVAHYSAADGSSAEGTPYWTYSMSFVLQFIEATKQFTGADRYYKMPFIQNAAAYRIGCSTPGFAGTLPWGDAPPRDYYGAHHMLARLADEYQDSAAQYVMQNIPYKPKGGKDVDALFLMWYTPSVDAVAPENLDYHSTDLDVVTTRNGWGDQDYMLSIKSGYTNRNHSHLDVGSLAFIFGDTWTLLAPGYGTGSGQADFWKIDGPRWDFFSNATESHTTLLINGENQLFDSNARATIDCCVSTPKAQWTGIDLSQAYRGDLQIRREVLHVRNDYILTLDSVTSQSPVNVEWLAQIPANATIDKTKIQIPSPAGDLTIRMLQPKTSSFYLREATSPCFDKPNPEQMSYAAASHGERVEFAGLMQPHFRNAPIKELQAQAACSSTGVWHASIADTEWQDVLTVNPSIDDIKWDADLETLQPPELTAHVGLVRIKNNCINHVFAIEATNLVSQAIQIKSDQAFNFSLDRIKHTWVLDLGRPISGTIQLDKGIQLYDTAFNSIVTAGSVHLEAGLYLLTTDSKSAESALIQTKSPDSPTP
jgi:hypothetical protein